MLIVDLSSNQGSVDFARLKRAGVGAVWMKVTEGATWDDPTWHDRADAARKAGLRVGGYHFARPDRNSATLEALHFARQLGRVRRRDLRPVLDFETHPATETWARQFNHTFREKTGYTPIFYSYPDFIRQLGLQQPVGNGLWLADYAASEEIPAPWKRTVAWQFTDRARLPGVSSPVDCSHAPRLRGVLANPFIGL